MQVEEIGSVAPGDFQCIAKTLGGDQANLDTLSLGQGIDDHGCAMGQEIDPSQIDPGLLYDIHHAGFIIRWCSGRFGRAYPRLTGLAGDFKTNQIGECSTNIGRYTYC